MTRATTLRTVDVASGSWDRARKIAAKAASYVLDIEAGIPGIPADFVPSMVESKVVEVDRQHARGCKRSEARDRLYVINRAWRLARQHVAGGPRFDMIIEAIDEEMSP